MINLTFEISNPFSDRWDAPYCKHKVLQHRAVELNVYKTGIILTLNLRYTVRHDHAGFLIRVGIFGWEVEYHLYDTRHWDDDNSSWGQYD